MNIQRESHRLTYVQHPRAMDKILVYFVAASLLAVVASTWSDAHHNLLGLLAAIPFCAAFWLLTQLFQVTSVAVFDHGAGTFRLTHSRNGRTFSRLELALSTIDAVIVEAAEQNGQLLFRPALLITGERIPLSFADLERDGMHAALQIRSFLGLSDSDIVHDSIAAGAALSRTDDRLDRSALVLTTRVVGMDPDQARDHVRSLVHLSPLNLPTMRPSLSDLLTDPPTFH